MNIKRVILYALLGMVTSEPFLGLLQQAADEARLMVREQGPLMQGIHQGLRVLKGEDDSKTWQSDLKKLLLRALRESRGRNRTLFLKALTSFASLQRRNASRGEFVTALSQVLGDVWESDGVKGFFGGEDHPVIYIVKGALEVMRGHDHGGGDVMSTSGGVPDDGFLK